MALNPPARLLTEKEITEIREGLRIGLRGPVLTKWAEQLLRDRDQRLGPSVDLRPAGRMPLTTEQLYAEAIEAIRQEAMKIMQKAGSRAYVSEKGELIVSLCSTASTIGDKRSEHDASR